MEMLENLSDIVLVRQGTGSGFIGEALLSLLGFLSIGLGFVVELASVILGRNNDSESLVWCGRGEKLS